MNPPRRIPFNRCTIAGDEMACITAAVQGGHISGDQTYARRCHEFLERTLECCRALTTTSCTHALEMAALLLDVGPNDEVIVPSFTFVSTVNAFVLRGATPVFCDIRPDTLNLNETLLEGLITVRTKVIVVVHYAGVGCEMDAIMAIASRHGIPVVEDNAHGLFGRYRGRWLGGFGCLATQSFHETKNLTCGEGGALLINDPTLVDRAEIIREKGTDRSRFFRGQVDKYSWVDIGSSYVMSDILAAFLYAQLERWPSIQRKRAELWETYRHELSSWARAMEIDLPVVPEHCTQAYHMFYLLMPSLDKRQEFIAHLSRHSIQAVFHYLPLHLSSFGQRWGQGPGSCPVTENVSNRLVRLPFYNSMDAATQEEVITTVRSFQ